jgi:hypothetical protein
MLLLVTPCGFQEHVGRCVVMMKDPVVAAHFLSSVSKHHSKSQSWPSVRRTKFAMNNPLNVEKNNKHALCWTPDQPRLFCLWWLWALPLRWFLLCFWIITVNPTFVTCYDPTDKSWVSSLAFCHSSRHTFACHCFWSYVKSRGTNFTTVWRMLKFSVKISWQTP